MKKLHSRLLSLSGLILVVAACVQLDRAQTGSLVRVMSNPDGPQFSVDGTIYYHAMSAFWPIGSLHTLLAPSGQGYTYNLDGTIQWQFQGWQWSGGTLTSNPVQVIASPAITQYTAVYSAMYQFTLQFSCNPSPCTSAPGVVQVNNSAVSADQTTWVSPGSTMLLQAFPNSGWTFAGWQPGENQSIIGFQDSVTVAKPTIVNAVFVPAKNITFAANPPGIGLQIYADHTLVSPPLSLSWGQGTTHTLGSIDVQQDMSGKRWVFQSWSDGGASTHNYVTANNTTPETITANHVAAAYPYFLTSPGYLNLVIDGLTLPPPYSFIWGIGQTHHVVAPASQTDSQGNSWSFKSWDDQVTAAARDITVPQGADVNGYRLTALYTPQSRLTIGSTISGLAVTVDGLACTTPCVVMRAAGTQVHVSAPASVAVGDGSRQDLLGWSTSGGSTTGGDWVATLDGSNVSVNAIYHLMNRLTATGNPSDGANWAIVPASPDGFYDSQTLVSIGVTAKPGYRFIYWSGDLSGSVPNGALTMSAPHQVVAQFGHLPYIAPSGVSNGAAISAQPGVAPGSVASIFGVSLAPTTAVGPSSPLVQTLGGIIVHIGTRMLPLYFASPAQINLQIPPDLAPGVQTITVSSQGMPDVSTDFTVVRNAPGLFPLLLDGQTYALVLHEDGTLVTPTSPAVQGELLTAYGTGFGPTDHQRPEGFAVPLTPPYLIVDPVTVQVATGTFPAENSFAAPGQIGLDLVQFRLDSSTPSGLNPLVLTVNGVNSNTLNLPVQ